MYSPPHTLTPKILRLLSEISEQVGLYTASQSAKLTPRLRRLNRIRTIQASLAIEANTLTIEQVTAILEGKRVLGPPREIQEVRNAIKAYEASEVWSATSQHDLLAAHGLLMTGLADDAGKFRRGDVGIYRGDQRVHMPPQAHRVPALMDDLLGWLKVTDTHPLVASCVFHYEFEFIHPFSDGNGRMGRLWQTLILRQWKPMFAYLPVETVVHDRQQAYYDALAQSTAKADSAPFIEFMSEALLEAIQEGVVEQKKSSEKYSEKSSEKILRLLRKDSTLSAKGLAEELGVSSRGVEKQIAALRLSGRLLRIGPDKGGHWEVVK
jgi:Fic family protein